MLFDTHCHLNFKAFDADREIIVRRSVAAEVERIVVPGTDLATSQKAVEIARQFSPCIAAVGVHPHHARDERLVADDHLKMKLSQLLEEKDVIAVGEIGMDYFYYRKTKYPDASVTDKLKEKQRQLFQLQLQLAQHHNLPVIIHCREAFADLLEILDSFIAQSSWQPRGVFHCFGGGKKNLQTVLAMGFYIGFTGNITYNQNLPGIVRATPLEHMLIETDAPFLTPKPYRGHRNEPAYLPLVARSVAKLHGTTKQSVARITTHNARQLFGAR